MASSTTPEFWKGHCFYPEKDRDTVFVKDAILFRENVRRNANGLINANGGVIYFGIKENGTVEGIYITRSKEDEFRLVIDHAIGSFQPFYAPFNYRVIFHPIRGSSCKIIELKISAGAPGQIYEDGALKIYLYSKNEVLGPLWPLEIQQLVKQRLQESLKSFTGLEKFTTPALERTKNKHQNEYSERK